MCYVFYIATDKDDDTHQGNVDPAVFGKAIDLMCRYGINAKDIAKHMSVSKEAVFRIIGEGCRSKNAQELIGAIGSLAIALINARSREVLRRLSNGERIWPDR